MAMKEISSFLIFGLFFEIALGLNDILKFTNGSKTRSSEKCCTEENLLSCQSVKIHLENFLEDEIRINNVHLEFSNVSPPYGRTYKANSGDEASISYNNDTGSFFANLNSNGRIFTVEPCHNGHVFKEIDVVNLKPEIPVPTPKDSIIIERQQDVAQDNSTIVTFREAYQNNELKIKLSIMYINEYCVQLFAAKQQQLIPQF